MKAHELLEIIAEDPFSTPPRYEKLVGDLAGCYSQRINIQHRLVYEVLAEERGVHVLRMGTRYEYERDPRFRTCGSSQVRLGRWPGVKPATTSREIATVSYRIPQLSQPGFRKCGGPRWRLPT